MKHLPIILALLLAPMVLVGQTWEPAARVTGAPNAGYILQHPSGILLVQLSKMPGQPQGGPPKLYDLSQLGGNPQPFEEQLPYSRINGGGDYNDDGTPEVITSISGPNSKFFFVVGPFSDEPIEIETSFGKSPIVGGLHQQVWNYDVDNDGFIDNIGPYADSAFISYGDADRPLGTTSWIEVQAGLAERDKDVLLVVRKLQGKLCMLRLVFFGPPNNVKGKYQILELNQDDIDARASRIRTTVLQEYESERGAEYYSPIIVSDSVWWIGTNSFTDPRYIKMTTEKMEEVAPSREWTGDYPINLEERDLIGQWREDKRQPLVIDAARPILQFRGSKPGDTAQYHVEYSKIVDPNTLQRKLLGRGLLRISNQGGVLGTSTLVPDMDGDGLEDFVIGYVARTGEGSSNLENVFDYFLTSDRPTVSVTSVPKPFIETTCTFTNHEPAIIYNVLGEQVAVVSVENETLAPSQLEALPQGALWAVQGECVRRVQ